MGFFARSFALLLLPVSVTADFLVDAATGNLRPTPVPPGAPTASPLTPTGAPVAAATSAPTGAPVGPPTGAPVAAPAVCSTCQGTRLLQCQRNPPPRSSLCFCFVGGIQLSCDPFECCQETADCCTGETAYTCQDGSCGCGEDAPVFGPMAQTCSNYQTCCAGFARRRSLRESSDYIFQEGDLEIEDFAKACGEHEYSVKLYVEQGHLYTVVSPTAGSAQVGCPHVAAHSNFSSQDEKEAVKEVMFWPTEPELEHEGLHMGTFQLSRLAEAFRKAPVSDGPYHLLANNCATFQLNLASELGIAINKDVTSFVARRLLEDSGSALVDRIKQSSIGSAVGSLFFGQRKLADFDSDESLVEHVVETLAIPKSD